MAVAVNLLADVASRTPAVLKDLVSTLVSILKQVVEGRLPRDFDYHRVPALWIQVRLLKILATLGADDQRCGDTRYSLRTKETS